MHEVLEFNRNKRPAPRSQDENRSEAETRVAVIGGGAWGRNLVRCFAELGCLAAVVDAHQDRAEDLASRYGGRAMSFDQVRTDPTIQAVAVATPPSSHHAVTKAALLAGKHVFVEKPLTQDVAQAQELSDLAVRRRLTLMVGHVLQYHPAIVKLRNLIADGRIGRVLRFHASRLNLGAIRRHEDVLWCLGPHDISVILALVGSEPSDIAAVGGFHLRETIADTATLHLSFPGGEQAQINLSWLHPVKEHRLTVIGSSGMLVFDDGEPWERKLLLYPHQVSLAADQPATVRSEPLAMPLEQSEPLRLECEHFLSCVRFGLEPRTSGEEGLRVVRVLDQASTAMRPDWTSRRPVTAGPDHRWTAYG
jgi:predicted dehydrogenase